MLNAARELLHVCKLNFNYSHLNIVHSEKIFLVEVYFMQTVHKVKGKDLIKREGRKMVCFSHLL
jgi:hypothetical protein